ncbi:MAG: serine protease [Cyanobacteria bacterium J06649_4]
MTMGRLENLRNMLRQVEANVDDIESSALESGTSTYSEATLDIGQVESMPGQAEIATESLDLLLKGQINDIDTDGQDVLEAIVMPYYRPVVDIIDNQIVTTQLSNKWLHLSTDNHKRAIESTLKSIGRIEIPWHKSLPYAGTGFVVGRSSDDRGILMTNRHVAEFFSIGIGVQDLKFRVEGPVSVDFLREYGRDGIFDSLTVEKVLMIHPYWDMALLQVTGLSAKREPLKLSVTEPTNIEDCEVITIGYPGYDPTGDLTYQNVQNRIFRGVYYTKRLQPGVLRTRKSIESYNRSVLAITHDCSTLAGNSGSAVLKLPKSPNESIEVIGLHFAGAYLRANYAVSTYDLAGDSRIVDTGIEFSERRSSSEDRYGVYWSDI